MKEATRRVPSVSSRPRQQRTRDRPGQSTDGTRSGGLQCGPQACFRLRRNPANITQAQAAGFLDKFVKTTDDDFGFARLDHQLNSNNRLAIRYNVEDSRNSGELVGQTLDGGGIGVPSGGRNLFIRDQAVVGTIDSVLRPNLVNTVLVNMRAGITISRAPPASRISAS